MNDSRKAPKSDALWVKTQYSNLIRYVPSGAYFARIRVKGKLVRQSLKTDVLSVAKLRLGDLEKSLRQQAASQDTIESGKMTMGDLLQVYKQNLERGTEVKPSTKKYRLEIVKAVLKSWPDFERMDVQKLTERAWKDWAVQYRANYSATRFNGTLDTLRAILNTAVGLGVLYRNPINAVDRTRVRSQRLQLPDTETFQRFIEVIETGASRDSRNCADLVRFLTYGGFRIGEVPFVTWADCDFQRGKIIVQGHPETGTKNSEVREVPMIPDMRAFLERLQSERPNESPQSPVMQIRKCQKSMTRAARIVGMQRLTHHHLRQMFATRCIESGVDIPTVSRWLGHKDGGALAMRTYGHLRDQHSVEMAKRVTFASSPSPEKIIPMPVQEKATR